MSIAPNRYQHEAAQTDIYPDSELGTFAILAGVSSEANELLQKVQKQIRDGRVIERDDMVSELGDVLWHIAVYAQRHHITLGEVMEYNLSKLADRKARSVISGSGDNR